jgi:hypothetical protein
MKMNGFMFAVIEIISQAAYLAENSKGFHLFVQRDFYQRRNNTLEQSERTLQNLSPFRSDAQAMG